MRSLQGTVVAVLLVAHLPGVTGCATLPPHTSLPEAPTAASPYAERAAYVKKYFPDAQERDHLFLHGGDRIYYPEDLLPAVDPASPTAVAINDHLEARAAVEEFAWLGAVSSVTATTGLALFTSTLVVLFLPLEEPTKTAAVIGTMATGGGLLGAGLGLLFLNVFISGDDAARANEAADRASRTYSQALLDRVGVSIDADGNIVPLQGAPP